jgi:histidinol-phosphate aminotransferase
MKNLRGTAGASVDDRGSEGAALASSICVRDDVRAMEAYPVTPAEGMVKLDAMENPYRLPEALREQVARAVANAAMNRYPDPRAPTLQGRLREVMQVPPEAGLVLGNGSDEIISIVTQAVARPGASVLAIEPSFVMYKMSARFAQVRYIGVPLRADFSLDAAAVLAAIREHAPAVVWIAYPNNPTGNLFDDDGIERILAAAPGLVVIDEAYHIFAGRSFLARLPEFPNLMVLRTMSKVGLAGIRLGYAAAAPAWIREFDKVRPPYNVNVLTQAAAEVLLDRMDVFEDQARRIRAERGELMDRLAEMDGVTPFPTDANFILARVPDAPRTMRGLLERRVLVRILDGSHPLLANCLRFTVGTPAENQLLLAALGEAL